MYSILLATLINFAVSNSALAQPLPKFSFNINNDKRSFYLAEPNTNSLDKKPLLIVLHGSNASAKTMIEYTAFHELGMKENFITAYPQKKGWFDWDRELGEDNIEVPFFTELINHMVEDHNVDPSKVFIAGYSSGGFLAQALACSMPEKIAGIALVSATIDINYQNKCKDIQKPVLMVIGDDDDYYDWHRDIGFAMSVSDSFKYWKQNNKCSSKNIKTKIPDITKEDETKITLIEAQDCQSPTMLAEVTNGGHTWPGTKPTSIINAIFLGHTNQDIHGNDLIWNFFMRK